MMSMKIKNFQRNMKYEEYKFGKVLKKKLK